MVNLSKQRFAACLILTALAFLGIGLTAGSYLQVALTPPVETQVMVQPPQRGEMYHCPDFDGYTLKIKTLSIHWSRMFDPSPWPDCSLNLGWMLYIEFQNNGTSYTFSLTDKLRFWVNITNDFRPIS